MTPRRTFMARLSSVIAAVALAPEIAFGWKLDDDPDWRSGQFWTELTCQSHIYSEEYLKWRMWAIQYWNR